MGVILILGSERFLAGQAVRDATAAPDLDLARFDADAKLGAVLDELRTPSLLGGRRVAVVDPADALVQGDALAVLADYADAPVPDTLLILVTSSVDGRTKVGKRLKSASSVIDCKAPSAREMPRWISDQGREVHGLQIGVDAAGTLYQRVGDDLGLLDSALRRLKEQIAPRTRLEPRDIASSTAAHRSPILYETASALEERDLSRALGSLSAAFHEGVRVNQDVVADAAGVAPILLGHLHRTWVKLLRFHLLRREESPEDAARSVGVSPRATRFFLKKVQRWPMQELLERHKCFLEADLELKGGAPAGPQPVLEKLLLGLLA